jgi:CRP-like cAMP-binding protein/AmiR/NasT family two-component response regulator
MNEKILVIEDHIGIRENIAEILQMANYIVYTAENGKIGVEMALKHVPDIILCDIMMPELDGYGVIYMLHKHKETSAIPFIFLTAKAEHADLRKGMEMGADDYLVKPFDDMDLLNVIDIRLKKKAYQQLNNRSQADDFKQLVLKTDGLAEFARMIAGHKSREFKKGQAIYYEGDQSKGIFLILQGKVKTIKLSLDGRELMTGMYSTGDYLGINAMLSKSIYADTATAIEDSMLCLIPDDEMEKVINLYPDVARKFIHLLSNDNRDKEEQLLQLAYDSVRKKMAGALVKLYNQQNLKNDFFLITREDLAAMACMATETVSRTLSDFRNEKLIERDGLLITVLDPARLAKMKN